MFFNTEHSFTTQNTLTFCFSHRRSQMSAQSSVKLPHSVMSQEPHKGYEALDLNIENIVMSSLITTIYSITIHHTFRPKIPSSDSTQKYKIYTKFKWN
jgi:hypothetical protein